MAGITTNGTIHTIGTQTNSLELIHHGSLPVFQRKKTEAVEQHGQLNDGNYIPYNQTAEKIKESSLPIGSQDLLIGLLRLGSLMQFPARVWDRLCTSSQNRRLASIYLISYS